MLSETPEYVAVANDKAPDAEHSPFGFIHTKLCVSVNVIADELALDANIFAISIAELSVETFTQSSLPSRKKAFLVDKSVGTDYEDQE